MTRITVRRPDGTIETVTRPGTIIDQAMRRRMATATAQAGKGEIIGWEIVGDHRPVRTDIVFRGSPTGAGLLRHPDGRICKGCGQRGCDGECGLGDY